MSKGKGGGNKRDQFFESIHTENIKTLQWSLRHGGFSATRPFDDDDTPPLHLACRNQKLKSLKCLVESIDRMRHQKDIDFPWEVENNMTPLMVAAEEGWLPGVQVLLQNGADPLIKDNEGKLAVNHSTSSSVTKCIENWGKEEEEDPAVVAARERKRAEIEERNREIAEEASKKQAADIHAKQEKLEQQEKMQEQLLIASEAAAWPELKVAMTEMRRAITINKSGDPELGRSIDPALWALTLLQRLQLRLMKDALTTLPGDLGRLTDLTELDLSHNSLTSLPSEIGNLVNLKLLEVEQNKLTALPAELSKCIKLEVVNVMGNQLTSLAPLSKATGIITLNAAYNQLTLLDIPLAKFSRLNNLSLSHNQIAMLPPEIGTLAALKILNLANNNLTELPNEFGALNEKKIQTLQLEGNPFKDKPFIRVIEKGRAANIILHMREQGEGGKKKKK